MSTRGVLSVSLFAVSVVFSNLLASPPTFDWDHGEVVAGSSVEVKIHGAPCHPVTVVLSCGGVNVEGVVTDVPGTVSLMVPQGTCGAQYTISIRCPDNGESRSGTVT